MALRQCATAFSASFKHSRRLQVCVGNEACDADSIISAVMHAVHLLRSGPAAGEEAGSADPVPLLPVKRGDLSLRREAMWLLRAAEAAEEGGAAGVNPHHPPLAGAQSWADELLCVEEWGSPEALTRLSSMALGGELGVTLLDHNELKGTLAAALGGGGQAGRTDVVTSILDHHLDGGAHPSVPRSSRRVAFDPSAMVGLGSTCTLVAEDMLGACPPTISPGPALALLGVILLDTCGLDPAAGKVTARDAGAADALLAVLNAGRGGEAGPLIDLRGLYDTLQGLKADPLWWAALAPSQAVAYDFKSFALPAGWGGARASGGCASFGSSSLLLPLTAFLGRGEGEGEGEGEGVGLHVKEDVLEALADQCAACGLAFTLLLSMSVPPGGGAPRRQVAVYAPPHGGEEGRAAAEGAVQALTHPSAGLSTRDIPLARLPHGHGLWVASQGTHTASRKQVVPLLLRGLGEGGREGGEGASRMSWGPAGLAV